MGGRNHCTGSTGGSVCVCHTEPATGASGNEDDPKPHANYYCQSDALAHAKPDTKPQPDALAVSYTGTSNGDGADRGTERKSSANRDDYLQERLMASEFSDKRKQEQHHRVDARRRPDKR